MSAFFCAGGKETPLLNAFLCKLLPVYSISTPEELKSHQD